MQLYKESKYNVLIEKNSDNSVLLYNTVSGAVCKFDEKSYLSFHGKMYLEKAEIDLEIIRLGFLVSVEWDETAKLEMCKKAYIFNAQPSELSYVIAPTLCCNYRCAYCFESSCTDRSSMSVETIDKVVHFIQSECEKYPTVSRVFVLWFGGEPTLHPEIIGAFSKEMIRYTNEKKITYEAFMTTNGSKLNEKIALFFKNQCNILGVQISLDGLRQRYALNRGCNEDCYDLVLQNIVMLSAFWHVHIRFNVDKYNKSEIKTLLDELVLSGKCGSHLHVYFAPVKNYVDGVNTGLPLMQFEQIHQQFVDYLISNGYGKIIKTKLPNKIACACGSMRNYTCVIGPSGELYRCEHTLGDKQRVIGNVEQGFFHNKADMMFLNHPTPDKCLECNLLPICAQGCLADKLLHGIEFDCEAYRIRILNHVNRSVRYKSTFQSSDSCSLC